MWKPGSCVQSWYIFDEVRASDNVPLTVDQSNQNFSNHSINDIEQAWKQAFSDADANLAATKKYRRALRMIKPWTEAYHYKAIS